MIPMTMITVIIIIRDGNIKVRRIRKHIIRRRCSEDRRTSRLKISDMKNGIPGYEVGNMHRRYTLHHNNLCIACHIRQRHSPRHRSVPQDKPDSSPQTIVRIGRHMTRGGRDIQLDPRNLTSRVVSAGRKSPFWERDGARFVVAVSLGVTFVTGGPARLRCERSITSKFQCLLSQRADYPKRRRIIVINRVKGTKCR
jgi:hypothetical protein